MIVLFVSSHNFQRLLWIGWPIYALVTIVILISLFRKWNSGASRQWLLIKNIVWQMSLNFVFGFFLYLAAFSRITFQHFSMSTFGRSISAALEMFVFNIDNTVFQELDIYAESNLCDSIVLLTILSFICTITLLLSVIYSRIRAYYILHFKTRVTADRCHIYLFFGADENSRMLANNIKDSEALKIFVEKSKESLDDKDLWGNILNIFSPRGLAFKYARESNALVAIMPKEIREIDTSDHKEENTSDHQEEQCDILSMATLDRVKQLILQLPKFGEQSLLSIFFLSDNEDNNISNVVKLAKDSTIASVASKISLKIYCQARFNGPSRVIEDLAAHQNLNVNIVDSSHLAIELLKSNADDQPVRVAKISAQDPTLVTQPLEALIIGFGEVGRDAFRFIYEFGTFIQEKDGEIVAASPRITAVDAQMNSICGEFVANTPAIDYTDGRIRLIEVDCGSTDFYTKVLTEQFCRSVNYILIALADDDQCMSMTQQVFDRIRLFRPDMANIAIKVRCHSTDKYELMDKVAMHYNRSCAAPQEIVRVFGSPRKIFSANTIIHENLTRQGKVFMNRYGVLRNEIMSWDERRHKMLGSPDSDLYPKIDSFKNLRRKEYQDYANAFHIATKMWLLEQAFGPHYCWEDLIKRMVNHTQREVIQGKGPDISYPNLTASENELMLRMAMLEHARWVSSHQILGYQCNDDESKCDEARMRHNCLRPWSALDDESARAGTDYKAYDFSVVSTTIFLSKHPNDDFLDV